MIRDPLTLIGSVLWPLAISAVGGGAYLYFTYQPGQTPTKSNDTAAQSSPLSNAHLPPTARAPQISNGGAGRTSKASENTAGAQNPAENPSIRNNTSSLREPDPLELYMCAGEFVAWMAFLIKSNKQLPAGFIETSTTMLDVARSTADRILARRGVPANGIAQYRANFTKSGADRMMALKNGGADEEIDRVANQCADMFLYTKEYVSK